MARSDVEIGAASVTFNSVALGNTAGGVSISFGLEVVQHQSDQSTMIEEIFKTGEGIVVTCPFDESNLTTLQYAFPNGTYVLDSGGVKKKISVGGATTYRFSSVAYELVIDPVNDTGDNQKLTVHKAVASQPIEISLSRTDVRLWSVVFVGIRDTTNSAGNQLYEIGDSTATA